MRRFLTLLVMILSSTPTVLAQSNLLESVKRDPEEAIAHCQKFRDLNSQGKSASSEETLEEISTQKNLSKVEAEILSIYIIGLHCPDVK